jgi:hypothetical protein
MSYIQGSQCAKYTDNFFLKKRLIVICLEEDNFKINVACYYYAYVIIEKQCFLQASKQKNIIIYSYFIRCFILYKNLISVRL